VITTKILIKSINCEFINIIYELIKINKKENNYGMIFAILIIEKNLNFC